MRTCALPKEVESVCEGQEMLPESKKACLVESGQLLKKNFQVNEAIVFHSRAPFREH